MDAVADELGVTVRYEVATNNTLSSLLSETAAERFNLSIAGITITARREEVIDFR